MPFGEKGMCCRFCLCYGHKACYVWLLANKQREFILHACYTVFRQFLTRCAWACLGITPTGLGLLYITCYCGPAYALLCYYGPVCYFVGCCLATNIKWNGWRWYSEYGIRFLGVTSNKLVTFPRRNSFALRAHAALSGECNFYLRCYYSMITPLPQGTL